MLKRSDCRRCGGLFCDCQRRGQVTIFIIVGVVFLLVILLFFFIANKDEILGKPPSKTPQLYIEQCIAKAVQPSVEAVLDYGGVVVPRSFIRMNDHPYNYLCYADLYYTKCYNYYPMLHLTAQKEIKKDSEDRIKQCFEDLINDYRERGHDVSAGELEYSVQIVPGSIRLNIKKPIQTTKGDAVDSFNNFDMKLPSDLYRLIAIARSVVNQEAERCYFENNGFMIMYPMYNVTRFDFRESKIYEVQNRQTTETFKFAIRSCPYAPGIWGGGVDPDLLGQVTSVEDIRRRYNINDAGGSGGSSGGSLDYN